MTSGPLAGRRVLVTRSRRQASELDTRLRAVGAETLLIPTIETAPPSSYCALDAALASLRSFDWVLFTSANAVESLVARARRLEMALTPQRVAVVGPATAAAARSAGMAVDLMPPEFTAEALALALSPLAAGAAMLLVRAEVAPSLLPDRLTAAGAQLTVASAYRTVIPPDSVDALREIFAAPALWPDAVTFTSSSTVTNLLALLEAAGLTLPERVVRASIGPVTTQTLSEAGLPPLVTAEEATIPSLVAALERYFTALDPQPPA